MRGDKETNEEIEKIEREGETEGERERHRKRWRTNADKGCKAGERIR